MKKIKYKYSGKKSEKFWDAINKMNISEQSEMYSLGVALQNLEHQVIKRLNEILTKF